MELERNMLAVLELLKVGLGFANTDFDFDVLSDEDWKAVYGESVSQAVVLICFDALDKVSAKPPQEIYDRWFKKSVTYIAGAARIAKAQRELDAMLKEEKIEYAVLKGFSSAFYYPDPEMRAFGDIDFIVKSGDLERTRVLLVEKGFEMEPDMNDVHYTFVYRGIHYELHKTVAGLPEHSVRTHFEEALSGIVDRARESEHSFSAVSESDHAVVIFLHAIHHMLSTGMGLRQLCDWACFVFKTHKKSFWREKTIPLLEKTGTYLFASALTEACVHYLGIPRPSWCREVSDDVRDSVLREILKAGNFGTKVKTRSVPSLMFAKDGKKLTFFGKLRHMLKSLNETNRKVYPVLNKAPWLYPFIMVYRVVRHLVLILRGERASLFKVSQAADEKNSVFVKFDLYKTEK